MYRFIINWKQTHLFIMEIFELSIKLRSREYRFTHMNCSLVDIPFLLEALFRGENLSDFSKVANLMSKVW